jgi:hypothetical protein
LPSIIAFRERVSQRVPSHARPIEHHQYRAMHKIARSIFMRLTSSGLSTVGSFRGVLGKGRSSKWIAAFEHLLEKESQCGRAHLHGAGGEFPFL